MTKQTRLGLLMILLVITLPFVTAVDGVSIVSNTTEVKEPLPAESHASVGGSFTTVVLNVTSQTINWKAYIGNISGVITLDDSSNTSIYDWSVSTIAGEVYASRSDDITWANIECADSTDITNEEAALNEQASNTDSISNTFDTSVHKEFYVGTIQITASSCPAIATYVNDEAQSAGESNLFQEIILHDGTNFVYVGMLEPGEQGYDLQPYNFQMIVAEDATTSTPTTYYFYAELT